MQDVQARARRNGERSLNHVPLGGFGAIQRTETVRLPDSLCYVLSATWTKDPNFKVRKEIATQTDFVPVSAGQLEKKLQKNILHFHYMTIGQTLAQEPLPQGS